MDRTRCYNMDCMLGMKEFPDKYFDLAIVDPPFGNRQDAINRKASVSKYKTKRGNYKDVTWNTSPLDEYFEELLRISEQQIIWGANFFGFSGGYIVWNKLGTVFGEGEMAWHSHSKAIRFFEYQWNGMLQGNMKDKEERIHPTQKPVALYKWLLKNYAKEGDKILDTHLGSGSSRIAAFDGGFDFTGYELDKDYFEAQEKRFAQHKSQLKLFV